MKILKNMVKILDNVNATNVKVFDYENHHFWLCHNATVSPRQSNAAINYLKEA